MRCVLDRIYAGAGVVSAISILLICIVVAAQISLNILARIAGPALSFTIPSYADFSGFFLATSSFMGLAYTLRKGAHIRVNLLIGLLPPRMRLIFEVVTLLGGAAMSGFATWYAAVLTAQSHQFGDMSPGIIAVPLWIPQVFMVLGLGLLALAFLDTAIETMIRRAPVLIDEGGVE